MARLLSIGFYDDRGRLIMTCTSRKQADDIGATLYQTTIKEFFFLTERQLKLLSYAQAVDFESKMKENNKNATI